MALPLGELSAATPTERAGRVRTPVRTVLLRQRRLRGSSGCFYFSTNFFISHY
ncbi:MAG: hypothetical protein FWH14_01230 [Oscillospiraceae bacterium]|nr:hypothetical protein [Oscillospiraceae bacterium]